MPVKVALRRGCGSCITRKIIHYQPYFLINFNNIFLNIVNHIHNTIQRRLYSFHDDFTDDDCRRCKVLFLGVVELLINFVGMVNISSSAT